MGFGKHIGNLFTGPDIPVRNIVFLHDFLPLRAKSFTLSDTFHDCECLAAFHTHIDQISHNIVTGTDCRGNCCKSFTDKLLRISQPYICSVGKAGNTDQIRKTGWLCLLNHSDYKICSKLRNSQTSKRTSSNILRFDSQCLRTGKQGHYLFIIQRNILGVCIGQILQHTDDRRIIVSQNVQFKKVSVNGMIIKMCGNNI